MARRYYTPLTREDGQWCPQFGDFDRQTVEAERDDLVSSPATAIRKKDTKIIETASGQKAINAAIATLNTTTR